MDNKYYNIIMALIAALGAAYGGYSKLSNNNIQKDIERLSKESVEYRINLDITKANYEKSEEERQNISDKYDALEKKYLLLTVPQDTTVDFGEELQTKEFIGGGKIRAKFTDMSAYFHVLRITDRGPIIRIEECVYPHIEEGERVGNYSSDSFLVGKGGRLHVLMSGDCCRRGTSICNYDGLERFTLSCISYDIEHRNAMLGYHKSYVE